MSSERASISPDVLGEALDLNKNFQRLLFSERVEDPGEDGTAGLAGRIIDAAGGFDAKYETSVSLSTHILNTILVGMNAYVFDTVVRGGEHPDNDAARLLLSALALHDTNKYVSQQYDPPFEVDGNSEAVLDYYFEQGDDFGILDVLPADTEAEKDQSITDVKWLVQRTETRESGSETRGNATKRVRGLERYCRIGDSVVSIVGRDGLAAAAAWLEDHFPTQEQYQVNYLQFTTLEQPLLTNHLLTLVKAIVGDDEILRDFETGTDPHGIILGSTQNEVLYLGQPIDRDELETLVDANLMDYITSRHDFDCKTNWRSFEPDILSEINLGYEQKRNIIAAGFSETLARGSGTDHEFEVVPDEFANYLPELAHLVFNTKEFEEAFEGLEELPRLKDQVRDSDTYNNQSWKIGFLAELLRRYQGAVDDGYSPETLDKELGRVRNRVEPVLEDVLAVETDAGTATIDRFFAGPESEYEILAGADEMCFLCGRQAETLYQKGNDAFYGTNKFSRRVPPEGQYKRICPVCNLEHAILKDHCESLGNPVGDDTEIAFVYYDDFLGNVGVGQHLVYDFMDDDRGYDVADTEFVTNSFLPQFHLQPFYADSKNRRLSYVRRFLDNLVESGLKVMIGKPFTTFRPENAIFVDLNPVRRQVAFGADRVETHDERRRISALFELLGQVAAVSDGSGIDWDNVYLSIPDDRFSSIADLVVQHSEWYHDVRNQADDYLRNHKDETQYMLMREVAQEGLNLYGEQYDSRHKKTKIFREAIDATLDGLNRNKGEEELVEHVAGQVYKLAETEQYAPHPTPEKASSFVEKLFEFLDAEGSLDKASLSRRRNTLTNTYLFAYEQLLQERREQRQQEA